jgi:hypothetical protein
MSKYYADIEKRQFLLKEALSKQTRLPLLSDDEKALYEEYTTVQSFMEKQKLFCKKSISLCEYLLDVYGEYIDRLQNLYDVMNTLDLNLNASYDTDDVRYREKSEYICWADKVEKALREVLEYPKYKIFCNENLFYNDGSIDSDAFKPIFHFNIKGSNFDTYKSNRDKIFNDTEKRIRTDCLKISLGVSLTVVSAEWSVHNFNNFPVAANFPLEPDVYSSFDNIDLTTFLHSYSEQLMAVHEHINFVTNNKNNVFSDFLGCKTILDSTTRYLQFLENALDELTHVDEDDIRSMVENGNHLKKQLSELKIYDSSKKLFGGRGKSFSCLCEK